MASYQVPQFLDSGEKIFLSLNMRQFGYCLAGFFLCALIYTLSIRILPGVGGIIPFLPSIPIALFTAYLALGKYNGRDSEIYVLKYFITLFKPKTMIYSRQPYTVDLDKKLAMITASKIEADWVKRANQTKIDIEDKNFEFSGLPSKNKAEKIRALGEVDTILSNAKVEVVKREIAIEELQKKQNMLNTKR
jgi:PrgI family protein